ncbi:MAG TPA: hypothetical protein VFQ26_07615, partial [Nitrospiraceae bacterium]|nr:hypothetical protein [Nitrospiraceae bacterium]
MRFASVFSPLALFLVLILNSADWAADAEQPPAEGQLRPARNDRELRAWLENMVWHHGFSTSEMQSVLGLDEAAIRAALERFQIRSDNKPPRPVDPPVLVLPYPGGRHPRIGFLDGAVAPQRETKLSIFTPWDPASYVVLDVPEAVWSNLGLTYLAHTHVETVWSKQGVTLPQLEWQRRDDGSYTCERKLPNGIRFGVVATPQRDRVELRMWLTNGTDQPLSKMRVQMCAMLKGVRDFDDQTNDNKVLQPPFAACRNVAGNRWIIHAWQPCQRAWGNPPCPCLHSDPQLPDCEPGATTEVHGWLSFYEGTEIDAELQRIGQVWQPQHAVNVHGTVIDSRTERSIAARVYIQSEAGASYFVEQSTGQAVRYDKQNWVNPAAIERHTTIGAGPFQVALPPGKYTLTVERGKEYRPLVRELVVDRDAVTLKLPLQRWIDMAARGWYSGDTHVHRSLAELPNVMLAEDLNVAFPLTYWVTKAFDPPGQGDRTDAKDAAAQAELIKVDDTHVIWPRNTEWE